VTCGLDLVIVKRTSPQLIAEMGRHYSCPKGFVGRNICYSINYGGVCYGHIVGGSATRHLPGRDDFLGFPAKLHLQRLVNNIFFHIEPGGDGYPVRNFASSVIRCFEEAIQRDWSNKYGDPVLAFESLVELPRTGDCYKRAGWKLIGQTKGYTCKRTSGVGTDSWSGRRVWDTVNLRPKLVFAKKL